jgi:dienelactone hydrolase
MAEVVVFHHAQGLTDGVRALADDVRGAGHVVHLPDLYEGRTFAELADGVGYAQDVGFETIVERGRAFASELSGDGVVYAGLSLGVLAAQLLAQTRPGAAGALLLHSCVAPSELGGAWPQGVPVQIHLMDADPHALPPNEDLAAARALDATVAGARLFLYRGDRHLFSDRGLAEYDEAATTLLMERALAFLDAL